MQQKNAKFPYRSRVVYWQPLIALGLGRSRSASQNPLEIAGHAFVKLCYALEG